MNPTEIEQKAKIFSLNRERQLAYIFGYKDAMEHLYTEEEVFELLEKAHFVPRNIIDWFNEFKKKS